MKYFYIAFISLFLFLGLSDTVSALPVDEYMDTVDIFDVYNNPQYDGDDYEVGYIMRTYADFNEDRYAKDAVMNVTNMQWFSYYNGNMNGSSSIVFGSYVQRNPDNKLEVYIRNNGNPLFTDPGTLGIEVCVRGKDIRVVAKRTDNSLSTMALPDATASEVVHYITFDNQYADIVEIAIYVGNITTSYSDDYRVYCGLVDYGYFFDLEPEPEPDPDPDVPEAPVFTGNIVNSLSFIMAASFAFIESLFLLDIVSGLSLGYFLFAVMILSLIFSFFLHKIVK